MGHADVLFHLITIATHLYTRIYVTESIHSSKINVLIVLIVFYTESQFHVHACLYQNFIGVTTSLDASKI